VSSPSSDSLTKNFTGCSATDDECEICATIRMRPCTPVRPSGDVIRTVSGRLSKLLAGRAAVPALEHQRNRGEAEHPGSHVTLA